MSLPAFSAERVRPPLRPEIYKELLWFLCCSAAVLLMPANRSAPATPTPRPPDREAITLVHDLLLQRPVKELLLQGVFVIRYSNGHRGEVPVTYSIRLAEDHWESDYQTKATASLGSEHLTVVHRPEQPNQYLFSQVSLSNDKTNSMTLSGSEAAMSFAGSDFWLSDLGLEFLHWPEQRLVRDAKITMRLGRSCKVLESTNPRPGAGAYSRVVSWVDAEWGSVIYAEAYDLQGKRFKVFSLQHFTKINGRWQVKDMEIRNDKADSRTHLKFSFEGE